MTGEKKPDEVKFCLQCQKQMTRKRFSGVLEDGGVFHRRKFCDRICMAKHQEKEIKTKHTLLKKALKFRGRVCEKCGTTQQLNIHHINLDESDNSPENLMTLCAPCHTTWHWEHGKQPATKRQNMYCKICGQPAKKLGMKPIYETYDGSHHTIAGNRKIAELIFADLKRRGYFDETSQ